MSANDPASHVATDLQELAGATRTFLQQHLNALGRAPLDVSPEDAARTADAVESGLSGTLRPALDGLRERAGVTAPPPPAAWADALGQLERAASGDAHARLAAAFASADRRILEAGGAFLHARVALARQDFPDSDMGARTVRATREADRALERARGAANDLVRALDALAALASGRAPGGGASDAGAALALARQALAAGIPAAAVPALDAALARAMASRLECAPGPLPDLLVRWREEGLDLPGGLPRDYECLITRLAQRTEDSITVSRLMDIVEVVANGLAMAGRPPP